MGFDDPLPIFLQPLKQLQCWEALHSLPSGQVMPCTALAVCGGEGGMGVNVVTGGEDGRITVLRTNDLQPLTVIGNIRMIPYKFT